MTQRVTAKTSVCSFSFQTINLRCQNQIIRQGQQGEVKKKGGGIVSRGLELIICQ
ncbi:unnamed protein product [Paramecium primaurelia]|uniref:Uncharacterized protein n=1 Tax=Paramecium primaurelia TaxID=5886 RepID=A0A8S1Q169_PARPR|nr:unnamed protein product [Paramecium primaurelia]